MQPISFSYYTDMLDYVDFAGLNEILNIVEDIMIHFVCLETSVCIELK